MPSIESRLAELERIKEKEFSETMTPVEFAHRVSHLYARLKEDPTEEEIELAAKIKKFLAECKAKRLEEAGEKSSAEPVEVNVAFTPVNDCPHLIPLAETVSYPAVAPLTVPKPSPNAEIIRQRIREMKRPKWTAPSA